MQTRDRVTGWTVGLLFLQLVLQGGLGILPTLFMHPYEESVQTFDGLAEAPVISLIMLLMFGFGIFRTLRLSLLTTFCMVLPFIDAAIALGHDEAHWDADSPGRIATVEDAVSRLTLMKYGCYAVIAALAGWAVWRARARAEARQLEPAAV